MQIQNYILLVEAGLLFALAFYVLLRNPKQKVPQAFFIMVLGGGIWVGSNAIDYIYRNITLTYFCYLGAIMVAVGFFYFSYFFPYQHKIIPRIINLLVIFITIIITVSLFINNVFFKEIIFSDTFTAVNGAPMFHVFNVYFIILFAWGIYNFFIKYRVANGLHHWQIKNVFYALSISLIAGVVTNLIFPWIFNIWTVGWIGPMFSIIFFGYLSRILFKKEVR